LDGAKGWVFIAVVLVILGYFLPMLYITIPTITIHWIDSLLITFLETPSIGTPSFVWWLFPIPLILAIIGWAGFSYRPRLAFLRIGFYPTSILVILLLIFSVYLASISSFPLTQSLSLSQPWQHIKPKKDSPKPKSRNLWRTHWITYRKLSYFLLRVQYIL